MRKSNGRGRGNGKEKTAPREFGIHGGAAVLKAIFVASTDQLTVCHFSSSGSHLNGPRFGATWTLNLPLNSVGTRHEYPLLVPDPQPAPPQPNPAVPY